MISKSNAFTFAGQVVVVLCVVASVTAVGLELGYRSATGDDRLPTLPVLILRDGLGGLVLYRFLVYALRQCGIAVRANDEQGDGGAFIAKPRADFARKSADGKRVYFCTTCRQDVEIDLDDRCLQCRYTV